MKKGLACTGATAALLVATLGSCGETDVVGRVAKTSFDALLDASSDRVSPVEGGWTLASPEGDEFRLSADFSTPRGDAEFSFDLAPFLAAGLNPAALAGGPGVSYSAEGDKLLLRFELGSDASPGGQPASMVDLFARLVKDHRNLIGYHEKLDHFGVKLGGGNTLEWAKDAGKNAADLVFVLNPGPFAAAGADLSKIEGWTFAPVEMKDDSGRKIFVDKLLKPFDLR